MSDDTIHVHVDNLSRARLDGSERSAIGHSAYICGGRLWDERTKAFADFTGKSDIHHAAVFLPQGAPAWASDREQLWNRVEASARRRDSRLAKTIDAAIPRNINPSLWPELLEQYVQPFVKQGMVADVAIHEDGTGHNPHIHVMLTVSAIEPEGFGAKLVFADQKAFLTLARRGWESTCNVALAASGSERRVDARSYKARGIAKVPTRHRGPNPEERQRRRAEAKRTREERNVIYKPSAEERHAYPLLTQRPDWPPTWSSPPADLTAPERTEYDRYHDERQDAERAARSSFFEHSVPEWWAENHAERVPAREPAPEPSQVPWYKQPSYLRQDEPSAELSISVPAQPAQEWQQPSLQDFRERDGYDQFAEERLAYEQDLWNRAANMRRTRHENELIRAAAKASPDMRKSLQNILFERRVAKLRAKDDAKRVEAFEARLGRDVQDAYDTYRRDDDAEDNRYPVPGPYRRLESPGEQRQAQDEMLEEYHREDRGEPER